MNEDVREEQKPVAEEGGVLITLQLSPEDCEKLLQAIKAGELAHLGVIDARVVDLDDQEAGEEAAGK